MKFTAVYNTESLKGIEYSFDANNAEQAKDFCRNKFSVKDILIICHDDPDYPNWLLHIGDKRKTSAIHRAYIKKHQDKTNYK